MEEKVQQVSVLSVMLFTLGFNDVSNITIVWCSLYVDVLAFYITWVKLEYMVRNLQLIMERQATRWNALGSLFSTQKADTVIFHWAYQWGGREEDHIGSLLQAKFLGINLDGWLFYLPLKNKL